MIAYIKKVSLFLLLGGFSAISYGQGKSDIGLLLTPNEASRLHLEYRNPFSDKMKLRLGLSFGHISSGPRKNNVILASTDSTITFQHYDYSTMLMDFKVGVERQIQDTYFSFGADLLIGYAKRRQAYTRSTLTADSTNSYVESAATSQFGVFNNPGNSRRISHYFVPGLRLSFNLNLPISKAFIFHASVMGDASVRIYTGTTEIQDPYLKFTQDPQGPYLNLGLMAAIGMRYQLNSKK